VMDCCCMCKKSRESINHLLLHCFLVVWGCMGYALKCERFVGELEGQLGHRNVLELWRLATLCLMWCI
jgi:hypothetical protein